MRSRTFAPLLVAALLFGSVTTATAVSINIGSTSGQPGALVTFDATLNPVCDGEVFEVAGTDNLVTVGPSMSVVGCEFQGPFEALSAFALEPEGCVTNPELRCSTARLLALISPPQPIARDTVLYSCQVRIDFDAEGGSDPIVCSDPMASSPDGQAYDGMTLACNVVKSVSCTTNEDCVGAGGVCEPLPQAECNDGMIEVSGSPLPTHTVTPTGTITPTATVTPTPTATPTGPFSLLAADIGATDETIPLVDASFFGESGTVEIGFERITYRAKVADDLIEAQRGKGGTTPMAYEAGARVSLIAANSGGAGGGRGCAIDPRADGHAAWLIVAAAMLAVLRGRAARRPHWRRGAGGATRGEKVG